VSQIPYRSEPRYLNIRGTAMSGVMRVRALVPIDVILVRDARRNLSRDRPSAVEVSCGRIVTIDLSLDAVV
jgi:hypothetical protein